MEPVIELAEIRNLPVEERLELVAQIWDTILQEPEALPLSEELASELDRRLEEHRRDPDESVPWADVEREVFGEE
jgi:putative addiction module component (TIGR02574 family)